MAQSDEKSRGVSAREASRLRATLGSEPSGGYAYHDKGRVERVERVDRVRPARTEQARQVAGHGAGERSFPRTLMGGMTAQEALAAHKKPSVHPTPANEQTRPSARGSWPPMPHVPSELVGAMDYEDEPSGVNLRETQPGTARRRSATPEVPAPTPAVTSAPAVSGGAIWQAMPSVAELPESPPRLTPDPVVITTLASSEAAPQRNTPDPGRPRVAAPFRPSLAELEAEHADSYGDARVLGYEALVERNDWEQLLEKLNAERELSPALQLLKLVARRETLRDEEQRESAQLTQQSIALVAQILHLPEASPTALVLGKRVLRKNQPLTRTEPAGRGVSLAIVFGGLSVGAGIGWLITKLLF